MNPANAWITFGLRLVYGARILTVSPFPCGLRTDSRAPRGFAASKILFRRKLYKFEKSKVRRHAVGVIAQSRTGIAQRTRADRAANARFSVNMEANKKRLKTAWRLHGHRAFSAQPLHGSRTGSVRFPCVGCGDDTATALKLHDIRTISEQPLYGFSPACHRGPIQEMARCS